MAGQWGIFNLFPTFMSFDALTLAASRALVRADLRGQEDWVLLSAHGKEGWALVRVDGSEIVCGGEFETNEMDHQVCLHGCGMCPQRHLQTPSEAPVSCTGLKTVHQRELLCTGWENMHNHFTKLCFCWCPYCYSCLKVWILKAHEKYVLHLCNFLIYTMCFMHCSRHTNSTNCS